jgi:hypothetical protein
MGKCRECKHFNPNNYYCDLRNCLVNPENYCGWFLRDVLATLSEDEIAACLEVVEKMRAEKKKMAEIEEAKTKIHKEVNEALDKIGIEETKKIIRQINRELRDMPIED